MLKIIDNFVNFPQVPIFHAAYYAMNRKRNGIIQPYFPVPGKAGEENGDKAGIIPAIAGIIPHLQQKAILILAIIPIL